MNAVSEESKSLAVVPPPGALERYQSQLQVAEAVRSFVLAKDRGGKYLHLTVIGKGMHCNIEVWRAIAATAGYALGVTEVRQVGDGWEAHGVVRRVADGVIVGEGVGYCDAMEKWGKGKETHAIRGMAQTRAQSRAAAGVFGQLVVFIHEDLRATPAEEMTSVEESVAGPHVTIPRKRPLPPRTMVKVHPKDIDDGRVDDTPHDPVTGEVLEQHPSQLGEEEELYRAYLAAPNALAKGKLLKDVEPTLARRIRDRWMKEVERG